jgi:uncharacterized protein (DUF342 family)
MLCQLSTALSIGILHFVQGAELAKKSQINVGQGIAGNGLDFTMVRGLTCLGFGNQVCSSI